jgi:cytochrome b pre-mRNA-processing protein 3
VRRCADATDPAKLMISLPFPRRRQATIDALYGMIVAQARSPVFYQEYGVPDTVSGRLDMIVLHLVLALRFAVGSDTPTGRQLFDRFCRDIDDNFREMGVGDLAVPKQMRRVAEGFFGRQKVYEAALVAGDEQALAAAVARNVFGAADVPLGARRLAAYMQGATRSLEHEGEAASGRATLDFPDPQAFAPAMGQNLR